VDFYLAGMVVAFVIGAVKLGVALAIRFSMKARNMGKLGLHYRAATGTFEREGTSVGGWVGVAIWLILVTPFGSWVSVASAGWTYVSARRRAARASISNKVKAVQEIVATRELSREELIEAQEELKRELRQPGAVLTGSEQAEDPTFLVLADDEHFYSTVQANPDVKMLAFTDRSTDDHDWFHSVEEYRFVGDEVQTRLIEDYSESMGNKQWSVKDGVVLESELRKRYEALAIKLPILGTIEEQVARLKQRVEWQPVNRATLRFFVMSQHPTEFPFRERRRLIRTELERIDAAARRLTEEAKVYGLELGEGQRGMEVRFPASFTSADKKRVEEAFLNNERFAAIGMSPSELAHIKELRADLLRLLGEAAAA
jgi:hypothetical protein